MRCLVVDDEEDVGVLLSYYLRSRAADVDAVTNGEAARAALAGTTYDALLLDLSLPGESGVELLTSLRAEDRAPATVFLLSALPASELALTAMQHDAHPVPKPFTVQDLDRDLGSVLDTLD